MKSKKILLHHSVGFILQNSTCKAWGRLGDESHLTLIAAFKFRVFHECVHTENCRIENHLNVTKHTTKAIKRHNLAFDHKYSAYISGTRDYSASQTLSAHIFTTMVNLSQSTKAGMNDINSDVL